MAEYEFKLLPYDVLMQARIILRATPDFRYHGGDCAQEVGGKALGSCRYIEDGVGSCLFGKALLDLGVPADFISEQEENNIRVFWDDADITDFQKRIVTELSRIQRMQDRNYTYGEIYELQNAGILM
ncbi:hypothetical protein FDI69_gp171 [Rhodococcus phage Trina]|uniref:Uncharacterized protein n=1 Tax=Rhodococcus phage Trina TaxID=2027905 RepID=A0A2D0ZMB4_9CAUD|nr:hypothetical protein FDI69_gp171 [Rhodococcus phage Trina]ASZ75015.1 hypothetical protein SEA_TRINA_236 [Rhodococcus phage Trina]